MDIAGILVGKPSKAGVEKIVRYIGDNPERFNELITIFLNGPYRITQRATWPMSYCVEKHPALIKPHVKKIIRAIQQQDAAVAVKRNVLRLLQFVKIPKKYAGEISTVCFDFLSDNKQTIAVRVFAMTVLYNLAFDIPEIKNELRLIIEHHLPYASAGFAARAKKILKGLNR